MQRKGGGLEVVDEDGVAVGAELDAGGLHDAGDEVGQDPLRADCGARDVVACRGGGDPWRGKAWFGNCGVGLPYEVPVKLHSVEEA